MIQRDLGDGTYASYEEDPYRVPNGPNGTYVDAPPPYELPRYCSRVSQSSAKTCKRKATWWVSYFTTPGAAADTACDQHLAASIRFIRRRDAGQVFQQPMPSVNEMPQP